MFPHALTDHHAFDIARVMLEGFDRHYRLFRENSGAAKQRFEMADWHGQRRAQRDRIEFYDRRVDEATEAKLIDAADSVETLVEVAAIKSFLACDCACARKRPRRWCKRGRDGNGL